MTPPSQGNVVVSPHGAWLFPFYALLAGTTASDSWHSIARLLPTAGKGEWFLGTFSLQPCHSMWSPAMVGGALVVPV